MNILKLIRNNVSLLVVLLVLTAISGGCSSSGGGNGSSNNTTTKQSVNKKTVSELSLMGLSVGDKESKIEEILGKPKKKESRKGKMIYIYDDLEVEAKSGTIIMLVSDGKKATTKRGLHEGVSFDEVLKVYGSDNTSFKIEDMTAYEYEFKTADNYIGLLRFAVNNSDKKVNYISARLTDETAVEKKKGQSKNNDNITRKKEAQKANNYNLGITSSQFDKNYKKVKGIFETYEKIKTMPLENHWRLEVFNITSDGDVKIVKCINNQDVVAFATLVMNDTTGAGSKVGEKLLRYFVSSVQPELSDTKKILVSGEIGVKMSTNGSTESGNIKYKWEKNEKEKTISIFATHIDDNDFVNVNINREK